jgi:hypothetical protein
MNNASAIRADTTPNHEALLPERVVIPHFEVERWTRYYRDFYGITHSFEGLQIPAEVEYPTRLIVMHADVSRCPQRIAGIYRKRCNGMWWQESINLNETVPRHDRSGTYAIRVRDVREASDGSVGGGPQSAGQVWDRGWTVTTLPERLIDGDTHLLTTKVHLDQGVSNLCAGSRAAFGGVPGVFYDQNDGKVKVGVWDPNWAIDTLRFRLAIV